MAYVPGCRYDLFISYARENNRDRWVEKFEEGLGKELGDLLGRQFSPKESIFFDQRDLEAAQSFPDELRIAARNSAILVPVLSPGYLTSVWCSRERDAFFAKLPEGADKASCLAPILVRPIDVERLDPLYRNAQRRSFLCPDGQTPLAPSAADFEDHLKKFAAELKHALQNLRLKYNPVFLGKASASDRLQRLRDLCAAELARRCLRTVPEYYTEFEDADGVLRNLGGASLAVHFLGGADSAAMDAIEESVAVCAGLTLVYQPFGAELAAREQRFLDDFESGLQTTVRYQRLAGKNDQELLAIVDEQITRVSEAAVPQSGVRQLALVCDKLDLADTQQLKDSIRGLCAHSVDSPDFLGSRPKSSELLRLWDEYLGREGPQLFYHGAGARERLEHIWEDAQQHWPQTRRNWFLGPPELNEKRSRYPDALWDVTQVIRFIEPSERIS